MMLGLPEAAVGAICATAFAGFLTLIGLIIAKEQKVSDFRQAWIDALRGDLAEYFSVAHSIHTFKTADHLNPEQSWEKANPFFEKGNTLSARIVLRLNANENLSKQLIAQMKSIELGARDGSAKISDLNKLVDDALGTAAKVLKTEWKRVKKGELYYRMCTAFAIMLIITPIVIGGLHMYTSRSSTSEPVSQSEAEAPKVP